MDTNNKTITITEEEHAELVKRSEFLSYLEGAGVDDWEGYSDACEMMEDANYGN